MTSISEDQTLPLGMENTLNQMELSKTDSMATVNDVSTVSDVSDPHHPVSGSPGTLSGATGRLSPQRSRLMKDQETQLSELKKDNFGLKLRIYHLEEALRKQMGNDSDDWRLNVDLNVTIDSLKKELREKNELLLKAKHAMDGMALQHESHVKKMNEEFSARLAEERRKLQMAIMDRDTQAAGMESAQEQQRQQLEEEIARLKTELDDVYNELAEKEDEVKELQESRVEVDPLRGEVEDLGARLAATEDELQAVQDALQGKDKELEDLEDELNGKDKELEERNRKLDQLKRELERAKSAAGQQGSVVAEQEMELSALRHKLGALQSEAQEAKELSAALKKKDGEVDALRDALQDLEQELDGAKRDMTELVDDRKSVQDQYSQDLNDALADNDALKDQVQDLENKLELLGPELSKRDAVIAKLQEALKEKGDQLAKQDQQLLDLSTRKAAEVGVLEKALGDLRGVAEQQAEAEKDLKAQVESLEEEVQGLRKKVADQSAQIGQSRGPAHATDATDSDQLDDAESLRELHSQLESLRRRVGQKEAEVGRLEDELAHKDSTVRGLKEELKRARADNSAADKRCRDAEKEATELKDQLEALQRRLSEDREDSVDARTSVGSQTPPLVQGGHTMAELESILSELRRLLEQLNARGRGKETTNYFNLSSTQQPATDQTDLLERLLKVLSVDREPRIIQPSPVHVNVTVPSNQGTPIINVPPSPQHQVTVTEGSPKLEVRHMVNESSQVVPVTERASQTLPLSKEEEGQGAGCKLNELQVQNQEMGDSLRRLKARLAAVEEDNTLLLQKNDELAAEREAILEENATLTDQSRSMEKLVRNLSQQVEELAREREKMAGKLKDAGEMISVLQDRLTALQQEAAEKEDLIVELRGRIGHLQGQVAVLGSQSARKDRKVPSHKEKGVGLSESEEEADLSGIYDRLKELQLENKKLKRGLTDESKLAAESQQERELEMNSLQTKLNEAQEEIEQLREIARRSQTPDSRAATPFGMLPPGLHVAKETATTGVQTYWRRADKAVMVQLAPLQSEVQQSSMGVQHSPASTPPAPPLDASWPSTSSGVGERKPGYSWREDSRRAEDLSALDEQYQAGLRLNQFVQQRIAQQLQGVGSGPGGVAQGTGTAPTAMVDHGTSPVTVPDPTDALHSELAAAQRQTALLARQLQASQDTQQTKEGEVIRLHSKLVQSQSEMAALESQLDALRKEKNESITSLEKQRNTLLRKYKKAKSEIERLRVDQERAKVTEGVQAGPSVGEMSERSQKLEEDIETMSSQLQATAASQTALLMELELKEKETEQLMNHVAALTKELQVYQAAQSLLPTMGGKQDEVIQTDPKGETPQPSLPADFVTLMSEVGQLRDKLDASIRSNRDLSKELKKKLKEPQLRLKAKTRATQVSAPSTASSGVDDTTTISSTALTSQRSQAGGTGPSGTRAGKKEEKPVRKHAVPHSASAPVLQKEAEGATPRASTFAGRPSNITFQHPAAYSTPYPHRLVYSDSDEPLMSDAYLPTGGAQQGVFPTPFHMDKTVTMDRGTQHSGKDDKAVQYDVLGRGSERQSRIPRPTGHAAPVVAHGDLSRLSQGMQHVGAVSTGTQATGHSTVGVQSVLGHDRSQHSRVPPLGNHFALPPQRVAAVSEGTQATLSSSVGVQSGVGSLNASAQTHRVVSEGTQAAQYSSVGVGGPMEACDSVLTWSRASADVQSSPPHPPAEVRHQETLMKRKSSPLHHSPSHWPVQHSSHPHPSPHSHHTSLYHRGLPQQLKDVHYTQQSDDESTATFSTHASEGDQVVSVRSAVSQTRDAGTSAVPLRVVRLKDALVQTAHSGSIQPCAAVSETVLVDSAVGGDEGHNQVDKMIQTVQEAQKKLTHMLSVPELTVSDRRFLEELLQCLRQQQAELEEGRRLLSQLQRSPSRDASSQTSPIRSPAASSTSSLAGRVLDLSDVYQQLLDTRGHTLASRDNLKRYHSRRGAQQEIESEP